MKSILLPTVVAMLFAAGVHAEELPTAADPGASSPAEATEAIEAAPAGEELLPDTAPAVVITPEISSFCFFAGKPPAEAKYKIVRKMKLGKGTYGTVRDILPQFVTNVRSTGAQALIFYSGSQRFGFFPWRLVRPVVYGTGIKWADPENRDCAAMGGTTLQTILETDLPPPR